MEGDTVKEIIAVEKEIHRKIEAERQRWTSWLEDVRLQAEKQYEEELRVLEAACEKERREAVDEAEKKASALVCEAEEQCGRWRNISDASLEKIVRRHLVSLTTGGYHDSPDVES